MARIAAIEGLRGWLAWTVVFGHVAQLTAPELPIWSVLRDAAAHSVSIFIIISGFVITNVVLTRRETWTAYIVRRAFRIFPVYLVALAAGAISSVLVLDAIARVPWMDVPAYTYDDAVRAAALSVNAHPTAHWLLHLTLMQGVVPDGILPFSQLAFLPPAWSLSAEWQFYLVAPALIAALASPRHRVLFVSLVVIGVMAFAHGALGHYKMPSLILGLMHLFTIGIASRLGISWLSQRVVVSPPTVIFLAGLGAIFSEALPVFLWAAFLIYLINAERWSTEPGNAWTTGLGQALLTSPIAMAAGGRSYVVYALHFPVIQYVAWLLPFWPESQFTSFVLVASVSTPLVILAAEVVHRVVERPGIRLGAILANRAAHPESRPTGPA